MAKFKRYKGRAIRGRGENEFGIKCCPYCIKDIPKLLKDAEIEYRIRGRTVIIAMEDEPLARMICNGVVC